MKKILYMIPVLLLLVVGMYFHNKAGIKDEEVISLSEDILNDYEDIIIKHGNNEEKLIALTFDDGPHKDFTPQILGVLKENDVKATFFVVGEMVDWNSEIVKREYNEGHEIGNHTFTHINVEKRSYSEINKEINQTQEAVKKVIGKEPNLFRPPYRAISKNMCTIAKDKNMNIILWSNLDPRDWSNPGVNYIVETIVNKVQNGTIILLHDYNNSKNSTTQTIQALKIVIPKLKEQGYKFVTISELMNHMDKDKQTQNKK
ncbi:polysaccharide deacetylase family protein [[Clostridium] dakarense]|uniref:polysaccharide deacetylase family protein n=1 Tax=Faecalimicrobium dakarense TaxID=1301100 RepID=UPI0004B2F6D7|nr:polysaccharide deacetylase family protein [[Clostridium] dakarense]